jgi:hypothetical protein
MMQLDTRLPLATQQGPSFNEDMGGAMTLSNMARKRNAEDMAMLQQQQAQQAAMNKQNAINQVFKSSLDESGNLDQKRAIAGLYSVDPDMAKKYESSWVADQEKKSLAMKAQAEAALFEEKVSDILNEHNKSIANTVASVLGAVTDASTYRYALPKIRSLGITPEMLPDNYLPEAVNVFKAQAITAKDQIENAYKNRQQTEVERNNLAQNKVAEINANTNARNAATNAANAGKKADGKQLTDTGTMAFQQAAIAGQTAMKLKNKIDEIANLKKGPISGYVLGKNPYDAELKEVENYVNMLVPSLSRGVFKEVGVLTDKDIDRYKKMVATAKTDPKVAKKIMGNLLGQIDDTYKLYKKTYKAAGYDISGFDEYGSVYDITGSNGAEPPVAGDKTVKSSVGDIGSVKKKYSLDY